METRPYKWSIKKSLSPEPLKGVVGTEGPWRCILKDVTEENAKILGWTFAKFRMKDEDGEIHLEGAIMYHPKYESSGFEPLDDYGMPGLGCTDIFYLEGGRWEIL